MTIVVQPNVITRVEKAGVQTGEMVRITETGFERMHTAPPACCGSDERQSDTPTEPRAVPDAFLAKPRVGGENGHSLRSLTRVHSWSMELRHRIAGDTSKPNGRSSALIRKR
jgi:hypothetical protein